MKCSFFNIVLTSTALLYLSANSFASPQAENPAEIESTMKKATQFMVDSVSYKGGYLWSYLPDFSRRWGEMEAYETMIWVQAPGTASMGHVFLDAYHATNDDYYYEAALKVASALMKGQHESGGWNYLIDFAGEKSIKRWYETIGAAGWRLEEFHHYYGNATFDDGATIEASEFLLRLYLEKKDKKVKRGLDKAIQFVLDSQHPIGGWPQRYPESDTFSHHGLPDYSQFITYNDNVAAANIEFLLFYYQSTGDKRVLDAIIRGINAFLVTHVGPPQSGWALQYSLDLQPATARTYEPKALSAATTFANIYQLIEFYKITGESKFIARVPEAIAWLKSLAIETEEGIRYPMMVELETNKVLYVHRRGSNSANGEYYTNYEYEPPLIHYRPLRELNIDWLEAHYESVLKTPKETLTKDSPLLISDTIPLPKYFTLKRARISDLNSRNHRSDTSDDGRSPAQILMDSLNDEGYWLTPLRATSNPYIGPPPMEVTPGDFSGTRAGDKYDTSPYYAAEPEMGISTGVYIYNMGVLIKSLLGEDAE